ncbi:MAG: carboxypeptidase-like regulatory domain-containing protein [Sulfolobales archaeon]
MSGDDLLLIAFDLAILTYNLGVVLYSLPIPLKSVKRWGTNLIIDGISTSILISSFTLILGLANLLQSLLNADWNAYFTWVGSRIAMVFSAFSALTYISGLIKSYTSILSSPINIVLGYLSAAFSALRLLAFLGSFILNYYRYLIVLGVLLYSLPMRIGKNAGAYLIAMSLVFYIGLPLMPAFVENFQASLSDISPETTSIYGYVLDSSGIVIPNAVIHLYSHSELEGTLLTDDRGRYNLGGGYDLLPRDFNYDIRVELYGVIFATQPENISSEVCIPKGVCNLNLTIPGVLTAAYGKLLVLRPANTVANVIKVSEDEVGFTLNTYSDASNIKLLIIYPKGTTIHYLFINGEKTNCSFTENFDWYGIQVNVCELISMNSSAYVDIAYESVYFEKPMVNEKRIISVENVNTILANSVSLGMALIFSLVFLPSLYMTLLLSISASLARFLGGRGIPLKIT